MKRIVMGIMGCLLFIRMEAQATQEPYEWFSLKYYEITSDSVNPMINIYLSKDTTGTGNIKYDTIRVPIDDTRFSEYVMTALLNIKAQHLVYQEKATGRIHFAHFRTVEYDPGSLPYAEGYLCNMYSYALTKIGNDIELEIKLSKSGSICTKETIPGNLDSYTFNLPATAKHKRKVKFDYVFSAVATLVGEYKMWDYRESRYIEGNSYGIEITAPVDGDIKFLIQTYYTP